MFSLSPRLSLAPDFGGSSGGKKEEKAVPLESHQSLSGRGRGGGGREGGQGCHMRPPAFTLNSFIFKGGVHVICYSGEKDHLPKSSLGKKKSPCFHTILHHLLFFYLEQKMANILGR